jgi:hypothetical protein
MAPHIGSSDITTPRSQISPSVAPPYSASFVTSTENARSFSRARSRRAFLSHCRKCLAYLLRLSIRQSAPAESVSSTPRHARSGGSNVDNNTMHRWRPPLPATTHFSTHRNTPIGYPWAYFGIQNRTLVPIWQPLKGYLCPDCMPFRQQRKTWTTCASSHFSARLILPS